jgi:tetratricopeptide (TPR) repeat protein
MPAPTRPRNYWQLPTFAVGVAAAAAAYANFPPPPADPVVLAGRDVDALREVLAARPVNAPAVADLARRVADAADRSPAPGAARFAAGSGFVALAESGRAEEADAHWAAAADLLAAVDASMLADPADAKRLAFRRAKALAATGRGTPAALYPALTDRPFDDPDPGELPRLLGEVCLKLDGVEMKKRARTELTAYLSGPPRLAPPALARLRLALGQTCMALNDPKGAKAWLAQVSPPADAGVVGAAKVQLAQLAAADGDWAEAVKLYDAALAVPGLPPAERGVVQYQAGAGRLKLRDMAGAVPYFEGAANAPGPVAAAAAVRLAEAAARDPGGKGQRAKAVARIEAVPAADAAHPLLGPAEVQAAFEEVIQVCLIEADYPSASRAADAYAKAAPPGRDRERRAEVAAAWAASLGQDPTAVGKWADAAADFAALAETTQAPAVKADLLRKTADCLKKGGRPADAVAALDRVTMSAGLPAETTTGAWLDKGDLLAAAGKASEAADAFQRAMAGAGPAATAARVRVGLAQVEQARAKFRAGGPAAAVEGRAQLELGQAMLAQVANKPAESPAERDAQQQALYELGKLLLQQNNYAEAEVRFRQLIRLDPAGPVAASAKLWLGSCLLLIARGDHQGGRPPADADRKLAEARDLFAPLAESADPFVRTQAEVRLANSLLLLKKYDELQALCDRLAGRYKGKVDELIVLSLSYWGHRGADRNADAARALNRMEDAYGKLADADFPGGSDEYTRAYWQQWFDAVRPAAAGR